ncbi:MAG: redoxin domain-containing protein [Actinomycetota bacterium]|nr:redoxin domain-containing protein [Actinomycetota bacterium]MDQ2957020.1 redoxin domain-containing protein [Actinomycetota bacterium]
MTVQQRARVRAPEFPSGSWFNVAAPLSLRELRGKIVLLDFWTFCCVNCLHVIEELRALEARFADELVIVGVHSPKFEHEKSDRAVAAAIERYDLQHPVFNDPELHLWQQYAVRAWPTLVLIDPDGYVVAQAAGEGQTSGLELIISELVQQYGDTLRRGDNPYRPVPPEPGDMRFPAKAIRIGDSLLIADSGHHQIVETELDGRTVRRRIGSGERVGSFAEPNGLAAVPADLASRLGFDLLVADTAHHLLRGVRLADGAIVRTVRLAEALAGTSTVTGPVPDVLSPWDVAWWPAIGQFVIVAAGVHLLLGWDPATDRVSILAGTTVEGLRDGPAADGWLAQPSGLAADGDRLWFADSETSALRYLTADGQLRTVVGEGLFDFGHVDGPAATARLQHPLGVAVLPDGSIAIADTYNSSVRRYDPATGELSTLATDLAEPSGLLVVDGELLVVESAAHRLVRPVTAGQLRQVLGQPQRTQRPATTLAAGTVELRVPFVPPPWRKLDERYGPSTQLTVSVTPAELLVAGAGVGPALQRTLVFADSAGSSGVLHVTAQAASCDDDPDNEHPACHLARQDWGVPIELAAGGDGELVLMLLG